MLVIWLWFVEGLPAVHSHNMDFHLSKLLPLISGVVAATPYFLAPVYLRKQIFNQDVNTLHQVRVMPFFASILSLRWTAEQLERNSEPCSLSWWAPMLYPWYWSSISRDRCDGGHPQPRTHPVSFMDYSKETLRMRYFLWKPLTSPREAGYSDTGISYLSWPLRF